MPLALFFAHVRGVAAGLPAGAHAINLCEDRYRFLVAFAAALVRGQTVLLRIDDWAAVLASGEAPSSLEAKLDLANALRRRRYGVRPDRGHVLGGHMGDERVTIKGLTVARVDLENNLLMIRGAVPGANGSLVVVKKS